MDRGQPWLTQAIKIIHFKQLQLYQRFEGSLREGSIILRSYRDRSYDAHTYSF